MIVEQLIDNINPEKIMGYYAEGHYSAQDFAEKCNEVFNLNLAGIYFVDSRKVTQGWIRRYEDPDTECESIAPCSEEDADAIAATFFIYDYASDEWNSFKF